MMARRAIAQLSEGGTPPVGPGPLALSNVSAWKRSGAQGLNSGLAGADFQSLATNGAGVFLAVASDGYAARSVDNGQSWSAMTRGLGTGSTTLDFHSVVYLGGQVFTAQSSTGENCRSDDNGATWVEIGTYSTIPFHPNCGASNGAGVGVIVGNAGYAMRTDDYGLTWNDLPRGLNSGANDSFTAVATDGAGKWIASGSAGYAALSIDNGLTWTALPQDLGANDNAQLTALGMSGTTWLSATFGPVITRCVDGVNWNKVDLSNCFEEAGTIVPAAKVLTNGSGIWIVFYQYAVPSTGTNATYIPTFYSCDDGVTWARSFSGLSLLVESNVYTEPTTGIAAGADGRIVAVGHGGWGSVNLEGVEALADFSQGDILLPKGLNTGTLNPTFSSICSLSGGVLVAVAASGYASRSEDLGDTWTGLPRNLNNGSANKSLLHVESDGANVAMAVGDDGYASRSLDAGLTWEAMVLGLNSGAPAVADVEKVFYCGSSIWVALLDDGYASRSIDDGVTWTALVQGLNSGSTTVELRVGGSDGNGIVIAGGSLGYMSRSTDYGATWAPLERGLTGESEEVSAVGAGANGVWCAANRSRSMMRSSDGGATWVEVRPGDVVEVKYEQYPRAMLYIGDGLWIMVPQHVVAYSATPRYFPVLVSMDDGLTWNYGLSNFGFTITNESEKRVGGCILANNQIIQVGVFGRASRTIPVCQ